MMTWNNSGALFVLIAAYLARLSQRVTAIAGEGLYRIGHFGEIHSAETAGGAEIRRKI
jgi:hypothetical protein